ncbi:hypothetical protein P5V15_001404 [Pogonomyrmex californicus]
MLIRQVGNMNNIKDREKIAKQIAKTSDSIRKKYRALKTSKIAEDIALERHFKPIAELLKQIVENIEESQSSKKETNIAKDIDIKKKKCEDSDNDDDDNITTTNKDSYCSFTYESILKELSKEPPKILFMRNEDVFETKDVNKAIDNVYSVYFNKGGTMLGDKKFDVDKDDSIIIDNVRCNGILGLYELIFKRLPDEAIFTEDDEQTYKSILLTTNAHRRDQRL